MLEQLSSTDSKFCFYADERNWYHCFSLVSAQDLSGLTLGLRHSLNRFDHARRLCARPSPEFLHAGFGGQRCPCWGGWPEGVAAPARDQAGAVWAWLVGKGREPTLYPDRHVRAGARVKASLLGLSGQEAGYCLNLRVRSTYLGKRRALDCAGEPRHMKAVKKRSWFWFQPQCKGNKWLSLFQWWGPKFRSTAKRYFLSAQSICFSWCPFLF